LKANVKFYTLIIPKDFYKSASYISGGCGSDNSWIDLVPDRFLLLDITICCKIHDYLYTIGGTEKDRLRADRMFRTNLRRTVLNDRNLLTRDTNLFLCNVYYRAVRKFGKSSFNYC
jgi:hypothetical protein